MLNFILIIISIICWGAGSFFYKLANDNLHPILVSSLVSALYIVLIPLGILVFKVPLNFNFSGTLFGLLGGLATCIASLSFFFILRNGGEVGTATAVTSLFPAVTLILSVIFLKEPLSWYKIVGCALALVSIYLLSLK